jgi:hypothetical protein
MIAITVHPEKVAASVLKRMQLVVAVGADPERTVGGFCQATGLRAPRLPNATNNKKLTVVAWRPTERKPSRSEDAFVLKLEPGTIEHSRHSRKYAHGDLEEDAFYFRGPHRKLNLRAQNLMTFVQIGEGVDDETWVHHLERGDYSKWIRCAIQDEELADKIHKIEISKGSPKQTRRAIRAAIERAYTAAA